MIVTEKDLHAVWPVQDVLERAALDRVLASGAWCRLKDDDWQHGECGTFERELGAYLGTDHVLAVANGTIAIDLGLSALGLKPGDEVLVQAGTFFGTVTPILKQGGIPVFADICADTCTLDPDGLEERLTPRTRGVITVPLCGLPPDMDRIKTFCERHGLWLLEDCAQAIGTTWKGRPLGTFGDIGTFSFQQDKPLQAGEGGALVCKDATLLGRVFAYHQGFGMPGAPEFKKHVTGTNARLSAWQAAVLRTQLTRLDALIDRRWDNYRTLLSLLGPDDPIRPVCTFPQMDRWSMFSAPFLFTDARSDGLTRDSFNDMLRSAGVPVTEGHLEPLYWRPLFRDNDLPHRHAHCPVTERLSRDKYLSIMHWFFLGPNEWMQRLVGWMREKTPA